MGNDKKAWYDFPISEIGSTHGVSGYWLEHGLAQLGIQNNQGLEEYVKGGMLKDEIALDQFHSFFANNGGLLLKLSNRNFNSSSYLYSWKDSSCSINEKKNENSIDISFISLNKDFFKKVTDYINNSLMPKTSAGRVFMLVQGESGFYLKSVGLAALPLEQDNYNSNVIKDIEHVIVDLKNPNPCGRIVVLDGLAGGGKTHIIKGLLNEVPKATFIVIPSNMISSLTSPSFMPVLINQQKPGIPLVLILEDSDSALSSRMTDNIDSISTILNFGSGLLGDLLDIRIIMTTNISIKDIDKAVTREGRLCRRIAVDKLKHEQAYRIYKRLTGKDSDKFNQGDFTLAQVYLMAKNDGYLVKTDPSSIGFKWESVNKSVADIVFGIDDEDDDIIDEDP